MTLTNSTGVATTMNFFLPYTSVKWYLTSALILYSEYSEEFSNLTRWETVVQDQHLDAASLQNSGLAVATAALPEKRCKFMFNLSIWTGGKNPEYWKYVTDSVAQSIFMCLMIWVLFMHSVLVEISCLWHLFWIRFFTRLCKVWGKLFRYICFRHQRKLLFIQFFGQQICFWNIWGWKVLLHMEIFHLSVMQSLVLDKLLGFAKLRVLRNLLPTMHIIFKGLSLISFRALQTHICSYIYSWGKLAKVEILFSANR